MKSDDLKTVRERVAAILRKAVDAKFTIDENYAGPGGFRVFENAPLKMHGRYATHAEALDAADRLKDAWVGERLAWIFKDVS